MDQFGRPTEKIRETKPVSEVKKEGDAV